MVFLFILLIFLILDIIIITSNINVSIINFIVDSKQKKHINNNYKIIIKIKILKNIPILKITITSKKIEKLSKKLKMKEKIEKIEESIYKNKKKIGIELIDTAKLINKNIELDYLDLKIKFGMEDAFACSILTAIIASILGIVISKKENNKNRITYKIEPIYNNQNIIKIAISGIFKIKLIHIINIIYVLNKKGGKKYERTSNRRSYDYGYE